LSPIVSTINKAHNAFGKPDPEHIKNHLPISNHIAKKQQIRAP